MENEVRYHHSCWNKYVSTNKVAHNSKVSTDPHLQGVRKEEVNIMMHNYVDQYIFETNEPRSLSYYDNLLENFNLRLCGYLSNLK